MLPPEIEEGNREYKRFFKDISKKRFFELASQMNWRLNEGNGTAYYFLGVNDNGTIHGLDNETFKYSIKIIKELAKDCDAKIAHMEKNIFKDKIWHKITIVKNNIVNIKEYRILLLGDTNTGKSTFLANLIKRKIDINRNAKDYIYNHQHELVSGRTSSINYYTLHDMNGRFLFFDSPGDIKFTKTLLKIIQSIDYNIVLYFPNKDKEWEYKTLFHNYFELKNVPIISLNLHAEISNFPNINLNALIDKDGFLEYIKKYMCEIKNESNNIIFNILNTFYNPELGWLLSGYLKSGELNINDDLYLYQSLSESIHGIKIKSIHCSSGTLITTKKKISAPQVLTLCIDNIDDINIKYGFISNTIYDMINNIDINWFYPLSNNTMSCNIDNYKCTLSCCDNKYTSNNILRENIIGNIVICFEQDYNNIGYNIGYIKENSRNIITNV